MTISAQDREEQKGKDRLPVGPHTLAGVLVGVLVGSILGIAGTYIAIVQRVTKLEDSLSSAQQQSESLTRVGSSAVMSSALARSAADPQLKLGAIIKTEQRTFVRESWGENAHESFTDAERKAFIESHQLETILARLERNNEFLDVILALKRLPPAEKQRVLESCRKPLHQTWAQMGRISRDGQTQAGQDTELMIANGIVDVVQQLSVRSEDEIRKLYS